MEHSPWIGSEYEHGKGINGQKIAVVGHSHYGPNSDFPSYTVDLIQSCLSGATEDFDGDMGTFNSVPGYFGFRSKHDFWPKVIFFNFLPNLVGTADHKFGYGTDEQIKAGAERLVRIFENYNPTKAFVFSRKAWDCCPKTLEEKEIRLNERLGSDFIGFRGGHYGNPKTPNDDLWFAAPHGSDEGTNAACGDHLDGSARRVLAHRPILLGERGALTV